MIGKTPRSLKPGLIHFFVKATFLFFTHIMAEPHQLFYQLQKNTDWLLLYTVHNTGMMKDKPFVNQIRRINQRLGFKYADMFFACSNEAGKYMFGNREFKIIKQCDRYIEV
jgi:hypothetical protein